MSADCRIYPDSQSNPRPLRVLLAILTACTLVCLTGPALAQGPGLYKDGRKVLDLKEIGTDQPNMEKSGFRPMTAGQELYQQVMNEGGKEPNRPFELYLGIAERCRQIVAVLASHSADDKSIQALVDLEAALLPAHDAVVAHLTELKNNLGSQPGMAEKLSRVVELENNHLPRAEQLLIILADLRAARTGGHVFAQDRAIQDLNNYFNEDPFEKLVQPVDEGFRPLPMNPAKPEIQFNGAVKAARAIYPPSTPAYAAADPADLAETVDVQLTPEIIALADSLGNSPVAIYYFVRDQFHFEPYLGSRKGSAQTLVHRGGNDYDQASLLIALLRASGIPARYATGRAYMPIDRAMNWLGFANKQQAGSLLATAGMQGTVHIAGPDTVGISCQRVWAEAYIPFANYRGTVNDSTGFMWVPMDPAFKQHEIQWGYDLPADMSFDAEPFVDDYITAFQSVTPAEKFVQDLETEMGVRYPGASLADLVDRKSVILEPDGILPGTLPYELLTFDGTFSALTSSQRYGIRFHVYGGGTDLDYSTTLPEIVLKQVTISYVGATPSDQAIIDAAGGIFNVADPYLVDVLPVLKIDGCEVARGTGAIMMGTTHYSDMYFTAPVGASNQMPMVSNVIQAGNYQGIGIDTGDAYPAFFGTVDTSCPEDLLGQELHQTALTYLNNVDTAEDVIAGYLHNVLLNDISEAIVENAVTVMTSGGLPVTFTWNGMIVDADRKIIGPFATDGRMAPCNHMRLAGADGSFQENRVFELRYNEEAISTIKILGLAADSLITVCRITNSTADCPGLNQPPEVISAINAALAQGHEVIIPERQFAYFDWAGTAWIDIDPVTCAAGYIISGGHNGGATVQEWVVSYPGLYCLQPVGDIMISPLVEGDYYFAESNAVWTFTVPTLKYWGKDGGGNCTELLQVPKSFVLKYTVAELAERFGVGEYTFTAGSDISDCNCEEKQKKATIVRLVSIKPSTGENADDKDDNPDTSVYMVSKTHNGDVSVEATLDPAVSEPQIPSTWSLTGGNGTQALNRSVTTDAASLTLFRFDFGEGTSKIETDLYVYDAGLKLYSNEGGGSGSSWANGFGHGWWGLFVDTDTREFIMSTHSELNNIGYFDEAGWFSVTGDAFGDGIVQLGTWRGGSPTGEKSWNIKYTDLVKGIERVHSFVTSPPHYNVLNRNCVHVAIRTGHAVGVNSMSPFVAATPWEFSVWLNNH